jgi:hypothetical protein
LGNNHGADIRDILNEVERMLSEEKLIEPASKGMRTSAIVISKAPLTLKMDIDAALEREGLHRVVAEVNEGYEVTLKGTVGDERDKDKAFHIAESFNETQHIWDQIFVIQFRDGRP